MDRYLEFAGNHTLLVVALVASFFLLVFMELRRKATSVLTISSADAVTLINKDALVLDLRSVEAFGRGHIVNARNVPFDELESRLGKLGDLANRTVIAVCDAGMSSQKAVEQLRKSGIEHVYGLKGGMNGWSQDGMPVVTSKKTATAHKGKNK